MDHQAGPGAPAIAEAPSRSPGRESPLDPPNRLLGHTPAHGAGARRYVALAVDFDGTLAHDGRVEAATVAALRRLRRSGRRLLLVTGRRLPDLRRLFPRLGLFDLVVAENGALISQPARRTEQLLADPPPARLIDALRARGVAPLEIGRVVVAAWSPHEAAMLDAIRDVGLEHQVVFNKGAVMVLPPGVNKASGLAAALAELAISPRNVVAVGDAENDHAFFALCEFAVAVANALPSVKAAADLVTAGDHGAGVVELIDQLLTDDLRALAPRLVRHDLPLGQTMAGAKVTLPPHGVNLLIAGPPGSGKSTIAAGLLERLAERGYQFCVIDPEGDYEGFAGSVVVGDGHHAPRVADVLRLLEQPDVNVVVDLLGLPLAARPRFFAELLPGLAALRVRTGRPHWLLVDESHHLLPASADLAALELPAEVGGLVLLTVNPAHVVPAVLARIDVVLATGAGAEQTVGAFARTVGESPPVRDPVDLDPGDALIWPWAAAVSPCRVRVVPTRAARRRHRRKYAFGDVGLERSFYFRGPDERLNLPAQNLLHFIELAAWVDETTWLHHLSRGDYTRWFREVILDDDLAREADAIAAQVDLPPGESRARLLRMIEERYTLPA